MHPDVFARLDFGREEGRCGQAVPALFEPLPNRFVVLFNGPLDDGRLARLGGVVRVRWSYRQLGLAEVDTADSSPLANLPDVVTVAPAWSTVSTTRALAVGLNALCAFATRQATDPTAFYRLHPGIGYPVITSRDGRNELALDPTAELPTDPALIPVVNMSLGTTAVGFPTAANDIVNLATAGASGQVLVVVAAGNCGDRADDTMSAWARPEWVLSVGATEDADGQRIAPYSSRGLPGPDLVALGESKLNAAKHGTSFAAPRVTNLARLVVAAFCELGREVMVAQGHPPVGVPAIGFGIIDDFGREIWWEPPDTGTEILALPLVGVRTDVVAELVGLTVGAFAVRTTPAIMREVLISAARPVPGATPAEAGAGFVDQDIVLDRLAAMTCAELWAWFGTGAAPDKARLQELRPFDAAGLRALAGVVNITGPTVKFDYKTGRWLALPQADARLRDESPMGWTVDLAGIRC